MYFGRNCLCSVGNLAFATEINIITFCFLFRNTLHIYSMNHISQVESVEIVCYVPSEGSVIPTVLPCVC